MGHSCNAHGTGADFSKEQDMGTQCCCTFFLSTPGTRNGENSYASAALCLPHHHSYSAMSKQLSSSLKTLITALRQPQSKNTTSCSELACIWQNTGKPTALTHLQRKVKMAKSSTEQHYSLVSLCSLAMALMVRHLQHLEQVGWLTSLSWNWLRAQTAPRCQQERPLSGRLSTICSMVTVPFSVGGGQRIVGGALGIQEHQSYCMTEQETTLKTCTGWYLGTQQRNAGVCQQGVCFCNMNPPERDAKDREML